MQNEKSTHNYWESNWKSAGMGLGKQRGYFWKRMDLAFTKILCGEHFKGKKLVEIGAGASEWLPHFSKKYLFEVAGLDYSEEGCSRAAQILVANRIPPRVYCADMFSPPVDLLANFDVACSFGLVEHFSNTESAVKACASFVKPGGFLITLIPNMRGLNGFLYKLLNRSVFDTHVPLSLNDLQLAHERAGLTLCYSSYLLGLPGILDGDRKEGSRAMRVLRAIAFHVNKFVSFLEERGIALPENSFTSPYMICGARVPGSPR